MKENKYDYSKESLKVKAPSQESSKPPQLAKKQIETPKKEEELSTKKALVVALMAIVMYVIVSAIPTFIMMYFMDVPFWISQLVVVGLLVLVSLLFGLHKPASNEQKLKSKFLI